MSETSNKDYKCLADTSDAKVECGKVNPDAVVSAFKVTSGLPAGSPVPHYMQMDKTPVDPTLDAYKPTRIGGTMFRGPGTFSIKHGDHCKGSDAKTGEGVPGVYIDAVNGDLVLRSNKRIRIEAENIDIFAKLGKDGETGVINIEANETVAIKTKKFDVQGTTSAKIFSDNTVQLIGKKALDMFGKFVDMADGQTISKGSVNFMDNSKMKSTFEQLLQDEGINVSSLTDTLKDAAGDFQASGVADQLRSQAQGLAGRLGGL